MTAAPEVVAFTDRPLAHADLRQVVPAGFAHVNTVVVPGERTPEYSMMWARAPVPAMPEDPR